MMNIHNNKFMILRCILLCSFRPCKQNNWEMLSNSSWQLLLSLFVISAYSLPGWNIDTQSSDMTFYEPLPESGTVNTASLAPATPDAFASIAVWGNAESSDELVAQGNNDCAADTKRLPRKMRARDENMCSVDNLQLNNGEESGSQLPPTAPNAQQGQSGQNSGGIGEPKRRLLFPPKDDTNSYLFIPDEYRPKRNSDICPEPKHPVPVCGRPSDAYDLIYPDTAGLTIDPCFPCTFIFCIWLFPMINPKMSIDAEVILYADMPFVGCAVNTIGYCCHTTNVAYVNDLTQSERDLWINLLSTSNKLRRIEQGLTVI